MKTFFGVAATAAGLLIAASAGAQNLVVNGNFDQLTNDAGQAVTAPDNYMVKSPAAGGAYRDPYGYNLTGWNNTTYYAVVFGSGLGDSAANFAANDPLLATPTTHWTYCGLRECYVSMRGAQDGDPKDAGFKIPDSSPQGGNYFGMSDFGVGNLTQTVNGLTIGQDYTLSFWYAAGTAYTFGTGDHSGGWNVTLGSDVNQQVKTTTFNGTGFAPWTQAVFNFTATKTSELLTFAPLLAGPPVTLLDGVSILPGTNVVPAVPEPEQWAMLAAGLVFIGGMQLRRRRQD